MLIEGHCCPGWRRCGVVVMVPVMLRFLLCTQSSTRTASESYACVSLRKWKSTLDVRYGAVRELQQQKLPARIFIFSFGLAHHIARQLSPCSQLGQFNVANISATCIVLRFCSGAFFVSGPSLHRRPGPHFVCATRAVAKGPRCVRTCN